MVKVNYVELRERLAGNITLFSHDTAALLALVDAKIAGQDTRSAAIEECAALMRRWATDAGEFKDDRCIIQHNVCRNAAVAISNLAKVRS